MAAVGVLARPPFQFSPISETYLLAPRQAAVTLLVAGPVPVSQVRAEPKLAYDIVGALVVEKVKIAQVASPPLLILGMSVVAAPVESQLDFVALPSSCDEPSFVNLRNTLVILQGSCLVIPLGGPALVQHSLFRRREIRERCVG